MADLAILRSRLLKRLPGRTNTELEDWIVESALVHGYSTMADVPEKKETMIVLYARYLALQAKAAETAENASLNIKGLGVNKSGASGNYAALVKEALNEYRREAGRVGGGIGAGVTSSIVTRPDGR